jgi:hypothetical protein
MSGQNTSKTDEASVDQDAALVELHSPAGNEQKASRNSGPEPVTLANGITLKRKIARLERELKEIDRFFYLSEERSDPGQHASMLERKRDDIVRSVVLQLHTATEDVLNDMLMCEILKAKAETRLKKMRSRPGQALHKMLFGAGSLGFDMKLNFAVAIGVLDTPTKTKLMELNTIRNKCSHNWLLRVPVRRGRRPRQRKPPLLLFRGRDIHSVKALEDFAGVFGVLYAKLFTKYLDY